MTWTALLRPRSAEGVVYRDRWVERFELIYDGWGVLIASVSAVSFIAREEWLAGAGFLTLVAAMLLFARRVFFWPHLVVGRDVLVLVGVRRTQCIPLAEVRMAVAKNGSLQLRLTNGTAVFVPGHVHWSHARNDCYAYLAREINARVP